jgi:death-on-curing protein
MEPVFLTLDEVLEIHEQQIERYGGSPGLRDAAGLESAVATPQATFDGVFLHGSIPVMRQRTFFTSARTIRLSTATNAWGPTQPSRSY